MKIKMTDAEIYDAWSRGNDRADGYPIGEKTMTPWEAAEDEGLEDIRTFDGPNTLGTCVVGRDGGKWIAICDVYGPWAVDITCAS